jgi:hypothetical protein
MRWTSFLLWWVLGLVEDPSDDGRAEIDPDG